MGDETYTFWSKRADYPGRLYLIISFLLCLWPTIGQADILDRVEIVIDHELNWLLKQQELRIAEVWGLVQVQRLRPRPQLSVFLSRQSNRLSKDPFQALIIPSSVRFPLPVDPGQGPFKLNNFLLASVGKPPERAIDFLRRFLATPAEGYILTHQFLVLEWAAETGLPLPSDLEQRQHEVMAAIVAEQEKDSHFSDLYAERAALIILYGRPTRDQTETWCRAILKARSHRGGWGAFKARQTWEGKSATISTQPSHTRVLSLMALVGYSAGHRKMNGDLFYEKNKTDTTTKKEISHAM
jgi:hypothetical protein